MKTGDVNRVHGHSDVVVSCTHDRCIGHHAALPVVGDHVCHRQPAGDRHLCDQPERIRQLRQPAKVWATGVLGLVRLSLLYFTALRNAPAVEAGLIAYLWPLLIVVGSALLPGERLRWYHVVGALAGLAGLS